MTNKYTISYTVFDTTNIRVPKPMHLKYSFLSEGDLLSALDEGGFAMGQRIK